MRFVLTTLMTFIIGAAMFSASVNAAHAVGEVEPSTAIAIVEAVSE